MADTSPSSFFAQSGTSPYTAPSAVPLPVASSSNELQYLRVNAGGTAYELHTLSYTDLQGLPTLGSAAALNAGTAANQVVQLTSAAKLPAVDGSQLTNLPSASGFGSAAALNVGTAANNVVQLTTADKLPAVDGSALTNIPYSGLTGKPSLGSVSPLNIGAGIENDGNGNLAVMVGLIGNASRLKVVKVSTTQITVTADQVVVGTALNGALYTAPSVNLTLNIATTGANGMDTGAASASADLSVYLIFNPTTQTAALLGVLGATSNGTVYSGAHMPAGYTASALVGSYKMDASAQFSNFVGQMDRTVGINTGNSQALTAGAATTLTAVSISSLVPANARTISGYAEAPAAQYIRIASDSGGLSYQQFYISTASSQMEAGFSNFPLFTAQTFYYAVGGGSGNVFLSSYTF